MIALARPHRIAEMRSQLQKLEEKRVFFPILGIRGFKAAGAKVRCTRLKVQIAVQERLDLLVNIYFLAEEKDDGSHTKLRIKRLLRTIRIYMSEERDKRS